MEEGSTKNAMSASPKSLCVFGLGFVFVVGCKCYYVMGCQLDFLSVVSGLRVACFVVCLVVLCGFLVPV